MGADCRSRTSPQHVCVGDSGHIALCNIGQNVAVLNELLLSSLDRLVSVKYFQTCHKGLP